MSVLNLKNQKPSQSKSRSGISGKHLDTARSVDRNLLDWLERLIVFIGIVFLIAMTVILVRTAVGRAKADAFDNPNRFRIEAGGNSVGVALVTDRDTGVQYLMNTHTGDFTVLVDKDGKPYLANGWRDVGE